MSAILLSLFIGLRHEVGVDWFNYLPYLYRAQGLSLTEFVTICLNDWGDPGYNFLNWLFAGYSWGIYGVNLISAIIFSGGLILFCQKQPRPRLAVCVSIPYFIIVVAMGYSRQAVAIGFIMVGLNSLERGRLTPFLSSVALAATFHSTALALLGFIVPAIPGRTLASRFLRLILLLIVGLILGQVFLSSRVEGLVEGYIDSEYKSEGAAIRVAMNAVASAILLFNPMKFNFSFEKLRLWSAMAYMAIACVVVLVLFPSNSTAVDRIALYIIPLQIVVLSHLPDTRLLGLKQGTLVMCVLVYCFMIQFVWLNFATYSIGWIPYSNVLLR